MIERQLNREVKHSIYIRVNCNYFPDIRISMKFRPFAYALSLLATPAPAANLSLSSTIDGDSYFADPVLTGSFSQINLGTGLPGDIDGAYNLADLGKSNPRLFGSGVDVFPTESAFGVGSLTYSDPLGIGSETVPIDSVDLTQISSDISVVGLGLITQVTGDFAFGDLDASDTLSFQDGKLSGLDLTLDAAFQVDIGGEIVSWDGLLKISDDSFSLQIDDTEVVPNPFFNPGNPNSPQFLQAPLTFDFEGQLDAFVPEPSSILLSAFATCLMLLRRKR
ncbi:MAG TPA: hypothetical protein DIV46_08715 [Verrucomicrobiales bacterium]|nr:hypothetical protein [Verrucomicrobiales bacterium]